MEKSLLYECIYYFKRNKGFKRIFYKIKEKYESLGNLGGNVVLNNLTPEEKEALTGFMKKDYYHQKSASISVQRFMKALDYTKFEGVDFLRVLEEYFGEEIIPKKDKKENYEAQKSKFFKEILDQFTGTIAKSWLQWEIENKSSLYKIFSQKYDADQAALKKDIINAGTALNNLPYKTGERKRLAVFASEITKNPHGLDENTPAHTLFMYGLAHILNRYIPKNAEERAEILYEAGIVKDDLSNYTLCSGLLAYTKDGIHEGWQGFFESREPLQVSLWNLLTIERAISPTGKVYVVENPTVFSELLSRYPDSSVPLICTYGQVKLASFMLLDLLAKEEVNIYYSGDFDPEGLLIADKLKQRYKDKLILWGYEEANYLKSLSKQSLSERRLKKLQNLKDESLIAVGEMLKEKKVAGYQEMFIESLSVKGTVPFD